MSRIGIYGGTFDPIHLGHLITVKHVLENRQLDKIIFMPSYISPLKTNKDTAAAFHRINMVKLAIGEFPQFEISDYEIKKEGISYTLDTIVYLKSIYKEIELIIGYDNLLVFDKWKSPEEIFKSANVVVMKRTIDNPPKDQNKYVDSTIIVDTPIIEISSTDIRERIRKNLSIDFLVPEKVKDYILQNKLYQTLII